MPASHGQELGPLLRASFLIGGGENVLRVHFDRSGWAEIISMPRSRPALFWFRSCSQLLEREILDLEEVWGRVKTGSAEIGLSAAGAEFEVFQNDAIFLVERMEDAERVEGLVEAIIETLIVIERTFPKKARRDLFGSELYQEFRKRLE